MVTSIVPTFTNNAQVSVIPRNNGEQLAIAIDNDAFADTKDFLIEKRDIAELGIQINNVGGANGLSFEIYGTIDPASTAPAFSLSIWELANNGSGDITNTNTKIFETKFAYTFLLVRLKRQTAGQDTTAQIRTTGTS